MTDVEFLRALADDFGVAAAWGEHANTCKRLREIGELLEYTITLLKEIDDSCELSDSRWGDKLTGVYVRMDERRKNV